MSTPPTNIPSRPRVPFLVRCWRGTIPAGLLAAGYLRHGEAGIACVAAMLTLVALAWWWRWREAFCRHGWELRPGAPREVDGLPLHVYWEGGESRTKPCAEVLLDDRAAEAILGRGLMPLLSVRDRDAVRLARFQSVAAPSTPLAGRWG